MRVKCGYVKVLVLNLYFTKIGCQVGQIQTIGIHRFLYVVGVLKVLYTFYYWY